MMEEEEEMGEKYIDLCHYKTQKKVTVSAKKIGSKGEYLARCINPAHLDVHPSMLVNPSKGVYNCPVCIEAKGVTWERHLREQGNSKGYKQKSSKKYLQEKKDSELEELAYPKKKKRAVVPYKKFDKAWIYYDEDGKTPLHRTCKIINPRKFWQECYDPVTKKWYMGLTLPNGKKVKLVLYNLKKIIDHPDKTIFIQEGEKACDRFTNDLGLLATTNPMGASNWNPEFNQYLKGRKVVAIPDNDKPGEEHVIKIADSNLGNTKSFKVIHLPDLAEKEDSDDWLDKIETVEVEGRKLTNKEILQELKGYVDFEEEYDPAKYEPKKFKEKEEEDKIITAGDFRPTDLWNSESYLKRYQGKLLYCKIWNSWLVYREGKWQEDEKNETQELAKKVIMGYYQQASEIIDDKARKILVDYARKSESQRAIRAMTELATSAMAAIPDDFDQDPYILNLKNRTLDLKTLEFREHIATDMLTKVAGVSYKPEADCPKWLAFLDKIFEGNKDLVDYIQTALGYSLTGNTGEQCWFILYGIGANGKSTFMNIVQEILGDYGINTPFDTFLSRGKGNNIPNDLARMRGARFVSAIEAGENRKFNEPLLKTIVGSDLITARFLRQEYFDFYPECKIWLASNHKPLVKEFSSGFWRKIRLIPFKVVIPEEERILQYDKILLEEKEGILNWILKGYKKWKGEKLKTPDEIKEATAQYRDQMDVLAEFIEECCIEDHQVRITTKELYKAYKGWCDENNEKEIVKKVFGRRLEERGYRSVRFGSPIQNRGWQGIGLKNKEEELPY